MCQAEVWPPTTTRTAKFTPHPPASIRQVSSVWLATNLQLTPVCTAQEVRREAVPSADAQAPIKTPALSTCAYSTLSLCHVMPAEPKLVPVMVKRDPGAL